MAPYGAEDSPPQIIVGSDATAERRGITRVCPGCGGGMGEGELCETCQYVADERIGMQGQAR
jgi:methionyl-tRNA synthetase